jgi:hypothetical protein
MHIAINHYIFSVQSIGGGLHQFKKFNFQPENATIFFVVN